LKTQKIYNNTWKLTVKKKRTTKEMKGMKEKKEKTRRKRKRMMSKTVVYSMKIIKLAIHNSMNRMEFSIPKITMQLEI
jgi:hypothetical protein